MSHSLLTHSPTEGYLDYFQVWATMKGATKNICVQASVKAYVFISPEYNLVTGITELCAHKFSLHK